MRKTGILLLSLALCLGLIGGAWAVTYTGDGGMVVGGDGTDDFSNITQGDPNASYTTIILPGQDTNIEYDENGNPIEVVHGPGPTFAPGGILDVTISNEDGTEQAVTLLAAGTLYSKVSVGRQSSIIPTSDLHYEIDPSVTADKRYAAINAKRIGYATMHTKASAKSDVIGRCTTNRIALVLSIGKTYAKVWCEGNVGYIKCSSLTYLSAAASGETQPALMSYNGRFNRRNTINIRQNGKNTSRIIAEIPCGTALTVFGENEDGWTEIEVNGWRAWVQSQYVTYGTAESLALVTPTPAPMLAAAESEYTLTFVYEDTPPVETDRTGANGAGMKGN